MCQAPRHFSPSGGALCLYQLGDVIEYDYVAAAARARQNRAAHQQHALGQLLLLLPGIGAVLFEAVDDGLRQRLQPRPFGEGLSPQAVEIFPQDGAGSVIDRDQAQLLVQYQHAGR